MKHLDFAARSRPNRGLTEAEKKAIAEYDGPVTKCPPGGNEFTWRPHGGMQSYTHDYGMKAPKRGGGQ